ncbi:hypothetical protein Rsub_03245 [Raphidocelis subcapitata]|uniref:Uncharacterized protein n=1 Tax=Raphidocelis subcapitata TaxID=307507 RepID=A0A2V0NYM5_9CHLO|nr:hypothetical protein Rsub_03245 [Raphidocelis subcapitata]|eukprot:GBF90673.1 hypothetical protein Rsub_03245 [Raphidocelis subcapitata]
MGQFASRHYDGDPYIELMRALPDRELIWWVQKAIWLAEGLTLADHFCRTYPTMFLHKCASCNGAGSVICPNCKGYKLRGARESGVGSFRLSSMVGPRRALSRGGAAECDRCGAFCDWDAESEWESNWATWESRLAYYDRTYGKLMDEWYEDVVNEGNLDMDTPHEELEPPGPDDHSILAHSERLMARNKKLMGALMRRYGGHPYERGDVVDFKTVDPTRPLAENMEALGYNRNELPPELSPLAFPELVADPNSALADFDNQIKMQALLSRNMEAALQDKPKPYMLEPTAGTVPCPGCLGRPWYYCVAPNWQKLLRMEEPFWLGTVARMNSFALHPDERATAAARHFLEYPRQSGAAQAAVAPLELHLEGAAARAAPRGAGWRAVARGASAELVARGAGAGEQLLGAGAEQDARRAARAAAARAWWMPPGQAHPAYGGEDPLSDDPLKALPLDVNMQAEFNRSPLDGRTPLERGGTWAADAAMPGRALAAKIRARRLERGVAGTELEGPLRQYDSARGLGASEDGGSDSGERRRRRGGGGGGGGGGGRNESALVADGGSSAPRR